jgi:hypothetical protein
MKFLPMLFGSNAGRPSLILSLLVAPVLLAGCLAAPADPTATLLPTPEAPVSTEAAGPGATPLPAASEAAYPPVAIPAATPTVGAYVSPATAVAAYPPAAAGELAFLPFIGELATGAIPTAAVTPPPEPTPLPSATPSPTALPAVDGESAQPAPTPIRVVDFESAAADLAAGGRQLAYNKIGFHVTFLEENDELDAYMQRLDAEGVPFFLKSVDNAEPLYKAQELMRASGVDHTLVYRSTLYDVPDYDLDPVQAAEAYWELEKAIWPPELDPGLVWFETMNELDKNRADWLAQFSLRTAELALRDGYKWAAFGWASGEPEPDDWESPAMLALLRLIGEHPDRLAIALHEYSYLKSDIAHEYPFKVGRFLQLFDAADRNGIPRPTVLITEWGWTYDSIPDEPPAMEDVTWAARLYGAYPQVKGAAVWNIGRLDGLLLPLNDQLQDLVDNLLAFSLDSYFSAPALPEEASTDPNQFLPLPPVE